MFKVTVIKVTLAYVALMATFYLCRLASEAGNTLMFNAGAAGVVISLVAEIIFFRPLSNSGFAIEKIYKFGRMLIWTAAILFVSHFGLHTYIKESLTFDGVSANKELVNEICPLGDWAHKKE